MKILTTLFLISFVSFSFAQQKKEGSKKKAKLIKKCNKNFSLTKSDASFSNYYISNESDTIYFNNADCILEINPPTTSSGSSKRRRVLNGWAEGTLEIYIQIDSTYSITNGNFKNGIFIEGTMRDYFSNGKVEQVLTYKKAQPSNLVQYDENGTVINLYDFVIKE